MGGGVIFITIYTINMNTPRVVDRSTRSMNLFVTSEFIHEEVSMLFHSEKFLGGGG